MTRVPKRSKKPDRAEEAAHVAASAASAASVTVEERGAFATARCGRCGWEGPARRSRERARKDLKQHRQDKPKHADNVSLAEVAPRPATPFAGPWPGVSLK